MADARGVEIREASIRLNFTYQGKMHRKTLMVNGAPMKPTAANRKYAERLIVEIRTRIRADAFSMAEYFPDGETGTVGRGGTVTDQLRHWLEVQTIESSTRAGYTSAIKFWTAALGGKTMQALRHSDVLMALRSRPNLNGKTINNYVSVLRGAMQLAVLDHILRENPVAAIENVPWQKEEPDPFDMEEVERIVAYAKERYHPSVANLIEFRFFSGVRTSEMVGLRWPAIDWTKRHMVVREAVVMGERKDTKTNMARVVHLNSRAMDALRAQRQPLEVTARSNVVSLAGAPAAGQVAEAADDSVFTDPRYGTPWVDERAFRRSFWTPALKALGIRYRAPNTARHTYATMLLMAGATPAYAAKQMGHSVEMFLTVYSKWLDGGRNDLEQAKLEAFITSPIHLKRSEG